MSNLTPASNFTATEKSTYLPMEDFNFYWWTYRERPAPFRVGAVLRQKFIIFCEFYKQVWKGVK